MLLKGLLDISAIIEQAEQIRFYSIKLKELDDGAYNKLVRDCNTQIQYAAGLFKDIFILGDKGELNLGKATPEGRKAREDIQEQIRYLALRGAENNDTDAFNRVRSYIFETQERGALPYLQKYTGDNAKYAWLMFHFRTMYQIAKKTSFVTLDPKYVLSSEEGAKLETAEGEKAVLECSDTGGLRLHSHYRSPLFEYAAKRFAYLFVNDSADPAMTQLPMEDTEFLDLLCDEAKKQFDKLAELYGLRAGLRENPEWRKSQLDFWKEYAKDKDPSHRGAMVPGNLYLVTVIIRALY